MCCSTWTSHDPLRLSSLDPFTTMPRRHFERLDFDLKVKFTTVHCPSRLKRRAKFSHTTILRNRNDKASQASYLFVQHHGRDYLGSKNVLSPRSKLSKPPIPGPALTYESTKGQHRMDVRRLRIAIAGCTLTPDVSQGRKQTPFCKVWKITAYLSAYLPCL